MFWASQAFSLRGVGLKATSKAIQVTQLAESAPNTHCVVWLFQVITYDFMSEYENIWMCKYVDVHEIISIYTSFARWMDLTWRIHLH